MSLFFVNSSGLTKTHLSFSLGRNIVIVKFSQETNYNPGIGLLNNVHQRLCWDTALAPISMMLKIFGETF